MDWITKLPPSLGYNSILTITNHDCSKAVIFIPCKEAMETEELAKIYFKQVFPHYEVPKKIISDRDPRLTSQLTKDICTEIGIQQNISTAYYSQMDGQSEQTNQALETYLRIFCNEQQTDWARWLPLAQFSINSRPSHTTKIPPFELLIGTIPRSISEVHHKVPTLEERKKVFSDIRKRAQEAILHSQMLLSKDTAFRPYKEGEQVWLDAKNLRTTHPMHKLRPKRYGPFKISKVLSHVAYQLKLPPLWKIHNVFRASYLSLFKETSKYGTNIIEPPPKLIDGEQEWEVEEIVGTRLFGKKRQRQYRVRWKGYSPAHDTWEPEENIHAPELVAQFKIGQPTTIRRARMGTRKESMPGEKCRSTPEHAPLTSIPTPEFAEKSPADVITAFGDAYFYFVAEEVARILHEKSLHPTPKLIAHYEALRSPLPVPGKGKEKEEGKRSKRRLVDPPTKPKDHQDNNYRILGRNISKRGQSHHYREPHICITENILLVRALLTNPVLDNIADLGYITYHMGTDFDGPPDPPWFPHPNIDTIPKVITIDENGKEFELPYLRYALSDGEPVILGTTGRDGPVYEGDIAALPAKGVPDNPLIDDTDHEELYLDHPFNWAINVAIYRLGDPGIMADVYRLRASYGKLKSLKQENERIVQLVEAFQKEQTKINKMIKDFANGVEALKNRLTKAKV
jgi:Chromo (CHRromatin Organisation MOdifier) domain